MNKILSLTCVILLGGCTMMPSYQRPGLPVVDQWPSVDGKGDPQEMAQEIGWRTFFKDPRLQKYIETALTNNRDLRLAALNVEAVKARYSIGLAKGFPTINAQGDGLHDHSATTKSGDYKDRGQYDAGLGITSYELDLFGRVRSLKAQALQNYFATEEARRAAQISLVAEVAVQYLTLQQLDEELKLTQEVLTSQESYYQLIKKSYELGNASELDLRSVEAQVQTAKVNAADYTRQHDQAQNALALLLGNVAPTDLPDAQALQTQDFLNDLPAGLPSDLLQRRPDILAAEDQLKGAHANIGAARAAFFPKITLTASGGFSSLALASLFTPGGPAWTFAPQIIMPIFDAGANKANLKLSEINKRVEIARYEKAIQAAFREVADALAARAALSEQLKAQQDLVAAQMQRYHLADLRYRNGVDSYLSVLSAQQDLYSAQQNLIKTRFNQLANLITLYAALGGGWGN